MTKPATFGLANSADLLVELRETVSDLNKDPVNPRLARYASIVAWSMCDWVNVELSPEISKEKFKAQCPALGLIQELANVVKHRKLRDSLPVRLTAAVKTGAFSREFSRDFDIARLELLLDDGTKLWFEDVIQEVLEFWEGFLRKKGLI